MVVFGDPKRVNCGCVGKGKELRNKESSFDEGLMKTIRDILSKDVVESKWMQDIPI